jgi:hypothetical protein
MSNGEVTELGFLSCLFNGGSPPARGSARRATLDTRIGSVRNVLYCEEVRGQSMFCPAVTTESPAPKYEVTCSYKDIRWYLISTVVPSPT